MSDLFRIIPVAPDKYQIKRKGWIFWRTIDEFAWGDFWPKQFNSKEDAMDYIDKLLTQEERTRDHLAQPVVEYP